MKLKDAPEDVQIVAEGMGAGYLGLDHTFMRRDGITYLVVGNYYGSAVFAVHGLENGYTVERLDDDE